MITSIIFSKDRPLQLDLCLRSIKKNFPQSTQNIVIWNNSDKFKNAQKTLRNEHKDVFFWEQSPSLFKDIFHALNCADKYVSFFTDDIIVYRSVPNADYGFFYDNPNTACISLRMGKNIVKRFHQGTSEPDVCLKGFQIDQNMILWPKTWHPYGSYWSYSLSVDGHIFRVKDMLEMVDELCFLEDRYNWAQTPNSFEEALQRFWTTSPNFIAAYDHSVAVNSPNNMVQDSHTDNMSGEHYDYDKKSLLKKYEDGHRINIDNLDFGEIKCPHTEIDILKGLI